MSEVAPKLIGGRDHLAQLLDPVQSQLARAERQAHYMGYFTTVDQIQEVWLAVIRIQSHLYTRTHARPHPVIPGTEDGVPQLP